MQISKWRFLIIFWLLAIVFLVGEFKFLRWRKEKLYSQQKIDEMILSRNSNLDKMDICEMKLDKSGELGDEFTINIFCNDGRIGTLSFNQRVIDNWKIENVINEVYKMTNDKKILDFDRWICKDKDGLQYEQGMEIGNILLIYCYEKKI